MGDAKTDRPASRILIVGKNVSEDSLPNHLKPREGVDVDIMKDPDAEIPGNEVYNIFLLEEFPSQELIRRLNDHSPKAIHGPLRVANDPDFIQAIQHGMHAFVAYEPTEKDPSSEFSYAALNTDNRETIQAIGERMQKEGKDIEFNGLEAHVNKILGEDGKSPLTAVQLSDMGSKCPEDRMRMAALSKQAMNAAKAYDFLAAFEFIDAAKDVNYKNEPIPDLLWAVLKDFLMFEKATEEQHRVIADILSSKSSGIQKETLLHVERTAHQLPVIQEISPSLSRLSVVSVSYLKCYRRENPDKHAIIREARIHRYFKRIQRRVKKGQNMIDTPDIISVVQVPDENRDAWALYREYVEGETLLDVLRGQVHELEKARNNNQPRKTTKMRSSIISLLMNAAQQVAYSTAYGPVRTALGMQDPLKRYYNQRMKKRIPESFDKLFAAAEADFLKDEEKTALKDLMKPIHKRLSSLPNAFYGDAWYGNSLITDEGGKMMLLDFFGARRLPAVIDLATLTCYGGFVNKLSVRRDTTERNMVETFFNVHNNALLAFNEIVSEYNKNPRKFIREEIARDAETFPESEKEAITQLLKMTDRTRFERGHGAYARLKQMAREGQLMVSSNYIDDLEQYAKNMRAHKHARAYEIGSPEYKESLGRFRTDYYCALAHRGLLLAATFCEYAARVENPEKRYRLIGEISGTLGAAERGVNRIVPPYASEEVVSAEDKENLSSTIRTIAGKVKSISRNFDKIFNNKEKENK